MKPAALILLAALDAQAAVIGIVPLPDGAQLRLHDTAGSCTAGALLAEYAIPGKPTVAGCWILRGERVQVAFSDGEVGLVPSSAVRKPEQV